MKDTRSIGQQAENAACAFLEKKGLKLLIRNYHCKLGEIDLIMQDNEDIVFIEVRKRMHADFASALESVTYTKQQKIIKTATFFLQNKGWLDKACCRFDVVGLSDGRIDWVKDAFS